MKSAVHIRDVEFNAIKICVSDAMRCLRTLRELRLGLGKVNGSGGGLGVYEHMSELMRMV